MTPSPGRGRWSSAAQLSTPNADGMPVVMSLPVNAASLQPEDFTVVGASGARRTPQCATLQPADSPGELRTVLLVGQLGGSDDPPLSLMITGEVLALDGYGSAFAGSVVVTPLADGPSLVLAEQMAVVDAGCSTNTSLRVTWDGGVSPDPPAQSYQVLLGDGRTLNAESLTDIGDMDNHHVLCVPSNPDDPDDLLVAVTFHAGLVQDPNNDEFNLAQNISVTHPPVANYSKQFTYSYSALADTSSGSVSVGGGSSPTQCDECMCSCTIELSGGLVTATIVPIVPSRNCTRTANGLANGTDHTRTANGTDHTSTSTAGSGTAPSGTDAGALSGNAGSAGFPSGAAFTSVLVGLLAAMALALAL